VNTFKVNLQNAIVLTPLRSLPSQRWATYVSGQYAKPRSGDLRKPLMVYQALPSLSRPNIINILKFTERPAVLPLQRNVEAYKSINGGHPKLLRAFAQGGLADLNEVEIVGIMSPPLFFFGFFGGIKKIKIFFSPPIFKKEKPPVIRNIGPKRIQESIRIYGCDGINPTNTPPYIKRCFSPLMKLCLRIIENRH